MNSFTRLKYALTALSLVAVSWTATLHAGVPSLLGEDHRLVMTVPANAPDTIQVTYTKNGSQDQVEIDLTEKLSVSISLPSLDLADIPFEVSPAENGFTLALGEHPETALKPVLGFASDLSVVSIDESSGFTLSTTVPGSTMRVVRLPENSTELEISGETMPFVQEGLLRIEFEKSTELPEETPEVPEDGTESGGCAMNPGAAANAGAWLSLLPLALGLAFRKRAKA